MDFVLKLKLFIYFLTFFVHIRSVLCLLMNNLVLLRVTAEITRARIVEQTFFINCSLINLKYRRNNAVYMYVWGRDSKFS